MTNARFKNRRGQALIESIVFFLIFTVMITSLMSFAQWFLIRQKMIIALRVGTFLYSSGRFSKKQVKRRMMESFAQGWPAMAPEKIRLDVGGYKGEVLWQKALAVSFRLDEIKVRYQPQGTWLLRWFKTEMEESCVIKHASRYGMTGALPVDLILSYGFRYGPVYPWTSS